MRFERNKPEACDADLYELCRRSVIEYAGRSIKLLGATHTPETLEAHGQAIEQWISGLDVVLLESAPVLEGWFNDEIIESMAEQARELGFELSVDEIIRTRDGDPFVGFYKQVEEFAMSNQKIISVADPNSYSQYGNLAQLRLNKTLRVLKFFSAVPFIAERVLKQLANKSVPVSMSRQVRGKRVSSLNSISRRSFILSAALAIIGAAGTGSLISEHVPADSSVLDSVRYDLRDFRDFVVSTGLKHLLKEFPNSKTGVIYGDRHIEGIKRYVSSDSGITRLRYVPFENIAAPSLRIYKPDISGLGYGKLTFSI